MKTVPKLTRPLNEAQIVERTVPPHLLGLMLEQVIKAGYDVRTDVLVHLNRASVAPLASRPLDGYTIARLAQKTETIATGMLKKLSPDNPLDGLYTVCMFSLVLVDEGLLDDKQNQAVLISLLLIEDCKDDRKDINGLDPVWHADEARWKAKARDMLLNAQLQGLYLPGVKH